MIIRTVKRYTSQNHHKWRILMLRVHQLSKNLYKLIVVGRGWGYSDKHTAKQVAETWKPTSLYCEGVEDNLIITRQALEKRLKQELPENLPPLSNSGENINIIGRT